MNIFDLVATIRLDSDGYERGLLDARDKTVSSGDAISASGSAIAASSEKWRTGLLGAAGAGAAALGAFAVASVKTGAEFDSSMSQVAATMGTTVDEIQDLRQYALDMGSTTSFSATQAADALNYMALAGYDSTEAMSALPNVLNLAAAGGIDLARASDMVTDAQSALGLSMEESALLVDKMAMAASKSNTSVEQLGEAILTVGGTAKNLAGGTTELSTALGILADNGIKGAEGGTALRNVILSLSAPTDQAASLMHKLGLEVYDAEGNMRPLNNVFGDLNSILSTMTQSEQTEVLNTLFNKVDLKSANALLANTGARFDELSGYIDNASGAAQRMADTQLDNLSGDVTLLKSAFEGLQIAVSDKLTPVFRSLIQFITRLFEKMDVLGPVILAAATAFGVFAVAINITSIITSVQTSISGLFALLAANPIALIIAGISAAVVAIITLWNTNEDFRNAVINIFEHIKSAFGAVADFVGTGLHAIGNFFVAAGEKISAAFNAVKDVITSILAFIAAYFVAEGEAIVAAVTTVRDFIKAAVEAIVGFFRRMGEGIQGMVNGAKQKFEEMRAAVSQKFEAIKTAITTGITTAASTVASKAAEMLTALANKLGEMRERASTAMTNVVGAIKSGLTNAVSAVFSIGANIVAGLWNGISSRVGWLIGQVRGFASQVVGAFKNLFKIASPSKVFRDEIGANLMLGLAAGIDDNAKLAVDAMKGVNLDVLDAAQIEVSGRGQSGRGRSMRGGILGGVTINIHTQPGQSAEEIAALVERRLTSSIRKRGAVFA